MSEVRKEIINRLTKLSGTIEVDEISEEVKETSLRFKNGTETTEDILNHCRHYILKLESGRELDLVEKKYLDKLIGKHKKLLAEREQDKKEIEELEEERQLVGMPVKNKRNGRIGIILHQWKSGSVAVLEKINPRVINTHDSWDTLEIIIDKVENIKTINDSIPKQKIIDKIKKLEEKMKFEDNEKILVYLHKQRKILQELLEDK